jgi:choline-sulfatase
MTTRAPSFHLTASLTHPHDPFTIHQRYWDLYESVDIPGPCVPLDPGVAGPAFRPPAPCLRQRSRPVTDEQVLRARRAYYGAISFVDDQFGAIPTRWRRRGWLTTVVILCGDHTAKCWANAACGTR